jgi:hypothetical protein
MKHTLRPARAKWQVATLPPQPEQTTMASSQLLSAWSYNNNPEMQHPHESLPKVQELGRGRSLFYTVP